MPLLNRQPDTQRCEWRMTKGGRCLNKTTAIIKVRVDGGIAEFGTCKRNKREFEPYRAG